ncbi:expressed unknown protein [Seminavis robusta]|uniref:Uncharacterized protein n=1 Tax=Seminavis robusta TaxID=568900 RepID=A0A9N8H6Z9_9STRA|nr:expressed unknown protein [Seminavis robusta]|eukprot:Sro162_g073000.1 n/a (109) ;mRNA; r:95399-95725
MQHLLDKFPGAAKHTDRRGEYPLHLLCGKVGTAHLETWITGLVDAHPSALFLENHNGKIPLDILRKRGLGEALLKERMSRALWGALRKELEKHRIPRDVFDYILTFAL